MRYTRKERNKIYKAALIYIETHSYIGGLCCVLATILWNFRNEGFAKRDFYTLWDFPELLKQQRSKTFVSSGYWWKKHAKAPRIKALKRAIKLSA